jgi:hypothetical protein
MSFLCEKGKGFSPSLTARTSRHPLLLSTMLKDIKSPSLFYLDFMNEDNIRRVSNEQWQAFKESVRITGFQTAMMAFIDAVESDGVINGLRPYVQMSAQAFTLNMMKAFDIQGEDIEKIGDVCFLFHQICDHDMKEIERANDKIVCVGGTRCHWRDNPKEMCITHHVMFINYICEAISTEYECRFTQMIPKGDHCCSYVIEKKEK